MSYEDLPCRDFVELTTDYLEGALSADQRLVVELHLAFCGPCVDYLDQLRVTVEATGQLLESEVPEPVMESLVQAFRALRGDEARPSRAARSSRRLGKAERD